MSHLIDKLKASIAKKVDKEEGKTLSSNDYTDTEKAKLAGIQDGAEVNVQADWSQNDETADDYVKGRTHYRAEDGQEELCTDTISFTTDSQITYGDNNEHTAYESWSSNEETIASVLYDLTVGEKYVVVWDGVEYICEFKQGQYYEYLGNGFLCYGENEESEEPFGFTHYDGFVYHATTTGDHTVTIKKFIPSYVTLPTEYLSEETLRPDYGELDSNKVGYIKNKPCYFHRQTYTNEETISYAKSRTNVAADFSLIDGVEYRVSGSVYFIGSLEANQVSFEKNAVCEGGYLDLDIEIPSSDSSKKPLEILSIYSVDADSSYAGCIRFYSNSVSGRTSAAGDIVIYVDAVKQLDENCIPDTIARTADVETALAEKSDIDHTHEIADVTDLQTTLDGKSDEGHGHEIADVNGLQTVLDGKETAGAAATALTNANSYTDGEIDTVTELIEEGLETKANASDLTSHVNDKSNPHGVTLSQLGVTATAAELNKMDGVTATTEELNYVDGATSNIQTQLNAKAASSSLSSHTSNKSNPHGVTAAQVGLGNVNNTADADKPVSTAQSSAISTAKEEAVASANDYTDGKIADLINSAPSTLDTLGEIATAMEENADVVEALNEAIGTKANVSDIPDVINNLTSTATTDALSAYQGKVLNDKISTINTSLATKGSGDMLKSVYDTDGDGIVDNAEKVNGFTVGVNVPANAKFTDTVYTHPTYTARTGKPTANATPAFGGTFTVSQITSDGTGHVTGATDRTITIPSTAATTSAAGLMSASDKSKLDGIASGANKITVDSSLSSSSTNPVQNKVVQAALNSKVNCMNVTTADLNTLTTSGFYRLSGTNDNMPSGGAWSQLLTMYGGGDTITQIIGDYANGKIFTRSGNPTDVGGSGKWTAWKTIAFTDSNIAGNAATATKATQDGSGNNIVNTYATKSQINALISRIEALEAQIGFSTNESDM